MNKAVKKFFIESIGVAKSITFTLRPHLWLGWIEAPLRLLANTLSLDKWIDRHKALAYNDFCTWKRDYHRRYHLYQWAVNHYRLGESPIYYVEFGVSRGFSLRWWIEHCVHSESRFWGFDTFEGLPEDWGVFRAGDMAARPPLLNDQRLTLKKGLFQDTIREWLASSPFDNPSVRKVIHIDSDLRSSALYVLFQLEPYLQKGDLLLFDEFAVPNHEFIAFSLFKEATKRQVRPIGATNNYMQIIFEMEE